MIGCKHEWVVIKDELIKAPYQLIKANKETVNIAEHWLMQQKLVVILKCKKCGKLDKTIETNPT